MPKIGKPFYPQEDLAEIGKHWRVFVGPIIPMVLMQYGGLKSNDKLVWAVLSKYQGTRGKCFPSISLIAHDAGISPSTVKNSIRRLKKQGFISVESGYWGGSNQYKLLWHPIFEEFEIEAEGGEKVREACRKRWNEITRN
jgi:DNA-binding transcriptional regulator PaaX